MSHLQPEFIVFKTKLTSKKKSQIVNKKSDFYYIETKRLKMPWCIVTWQTYACVKKRFSTSKVLNYFISSPCQRYRFFKKKEAKETMWCFVYIFIFSLCSQLPHGNCSWYTFPPKITFLCFSCSPVSSSTFKSFN